MWCLLVGQVGGIEPVSPNSLMAPTFCCPLLLLLLLLLLFVLQRFRSANGPMAVTGSWAPGALAVSTGRCVTRPSPWRSRWVPHKWGAKVEHARVTISVGGQRVAAAHSLEHSRWVGGSGWATPQPLHAREAAAPAAFLRGTCDPACQPYTSELPAHLFSG